MESFWTAFLLVFASEMGDKSQLASLGFATQHRLSLVLPAIFLGIALMMGGSTLLGAIAGHLLPLFWMQVASGVLFLVFGLLSLRPHQPENEHLSESAAFTFFGILTTFILSELGDKTIFATMALAGHGHQPWAVWIGSTMGMFVADVMAVVVGRVLGKTMPARTVAIGSAVVFFVAGVWTLWDAVNGHTS